MSLINCPHCGKLTLSNKAEYCKDCLTLFNGYHRKIREALRENPNMNMWDLHKKLEIPVSLLQIILKDDFVPFN